jgi:cell division protein FtsN
VDEPRTHYQVSFTSRQAVALFAALAGGLVGAYFLGLLTGLSGRERRPPAVMSAGATLAPTAAADASPSFPAPVLGVPVKGPTRGPTRAAPTPALQAAEEVPAPTPGVQLFQDRPSSEPTRALAVATRSSTRATEGKPPKPTQPPSGFWVQVDSLSSKDQAQSRRLGLAQAGFKAAIVPGAGPKGAVYRVRVGPYGTREEADRAASDLARKAKVKPWVVPPGQ